MPCRNCLLVLMWLACMLPILLTFSTQAAAQDFTVNSVADKVDATPGDGICSTGSTIDGHTAECTLRAAIDETNALQAADLTRHFVVSVMAGTYSLSTAETCIYTDFKSRPLSTTSTILCISSNLTLNGADQATTIVDHALTARDFFVSYGYTVAINNMTIQNGGQYGGSYDGGGGGINNQGNLTLSNDLLFRNHSDVGGAGVDNLGTLVVQGSTFLANSGPGLSAEYATTSIDSSYFTQNTAGSGAAVSIYSGSAQMSNSTASGNTVGSGGVVAFYSSTGTITNSTISDNTIGNSGAVIFSSSYGTLNNVTISGNIAGNSIGGLTGNNITMSNTILAGNSGYDCAVDTLTDAGNNLIQTPEPGVCNITNSKLIGVNAKLGTLAFNGGLVPTQQPLTGSPAIGAGSPVTPGNNAAGACTALDELGKVRGRNGACTIGAVEPAGSFDISNIALSPSVGAAGGTAWVVVYGSPFVPGSTLGLRKSGQPNIPVLSSTMSLDDLSITAQLDLSKSALGSYDLVVTTPAGASTVVSGAYTVQKPGAPDLYSYVYGPGVAHAGRPAFYTIVYGNKSNADAYLVPLTLIEPGNFAGLISSPVLSPPVADGQVIHDWTYVPVEVSPYSTSGFSSVPLIIPVIPAGGTGVMQFSVAPPGNAPEGLQFQLYTNLGTPYSTSLNGAVDPKSLADFVNGAQTYAQTNLGVTLTQSELAQMSTYASAQLAQVVSEGGQALLQSAAGNPVLFSNSQLIIDIATYGASLATTGSKVASSFRKTVKALNVHPDDGAGSPPPDPVLNYCTGGILLPGQSCRVRDTPVPTPDPDGPPKPFTAAECQSLPNYHVSPDGLSCVENPHSGCAPIPVTFGPPQCNSIPLIGSVDPNEKYGQLGVGAMHFTIAADPFHYQVEFENKPTATAPAQTVSVTDPLDITKYDLSTFQLGPISFGPYVLTPPPGVTSFTSSLDLRPSENVIVTVSASLDKSTGIATWSFTSLDPNTLQLVTDPTAGFLPPDTAPPVGIGHVAFSVQPLAFLASGTQTCNTASIVFDTNAAIATAPFCNTKDTTPPVSSVEALPRTESTPSFTVSWKGTDAGAGVDTYTVYVSVDGGAFAPWLRDTTATSAPYTGSSGHTYGFYTISVDNLGNTEAAKNSAEAVTSVGAAVTSALAAATASPVLDAPDALTLTLTSSVAAPEPMGTVTFYDGTVVLGSTTVITPQSTGIFTASFTPAFTTSGVHLLKATYSGDNVFGTTSATLSVTVSKLGSAIHAPAATALVYGTGGSIAVAVVPSATGTVLPTGSISYTLGASTAQTIALVNGAATIAVPTTQSAGTYSLVVSYGGDSNFNAATPVTISLTIAKATPVAHWATPAAITYGTSLTSTQLNATASVPGNFTYSPAAGAALTAGSHLLTATFHPADSIDYASVAITATLVVKPAVLTAQAANATRSYGAANPAFTYVLTGFVNGDTRAAVSGVATLSTTATAASPAGSYPIIFSTETLTAANYSFAYIAGTLTVGPVATVAVPVFSPAGGVFNSAQTVAISDASVGSVIHFTVDGSKPGPESTIYTSPITVSTSSVVQAVAILNGVSSSIASATFTINPATCQTINYSAGFTATGLSLNGGATVASNALELTDSGLFEARSAFFTVKLPTTSYTTDFTFQVTNPAADGIAFVIQSNNPNVVGEIGGGLGYAGIPNSTAIKADLHNNTGEGVNSTGTYTNGAYPSIPAIDLTPTGIDLHSGHIFAVHLAYANAVTMGTITDTVTGVSASMNFPGDITQAVGNNAWFGFTAGTGDKSATQKILTWSYSGGTGCPAK